LYIADSSLLLNMTEKAMIPTLTAEEIRSAGPLMTPDERAKVLKQIDDMYSAMGYSEDEIVKLPLKYVVKIAQVSSESTMSACIKYLEKVPDSLKAYLVANILPEDYQKEEIIARNLSKCMADVQAMKQELKAMREIVDSLVVDKPGDEDGD